MARFPSRLSTGEFLKPSRRQFTIGEFPTKTYRSMAGTVSRRSFGNKAYGHTLELEFQNVNQRVVAAVFDHYQEQRGTTIGFLLPETIFAGYENPIFVSKSDSKTAPVTDVTDRMRKPDRCEWFYLESPQIESTTLGLSTISVRLIAELEF
jgi:hypothetical protein